jgi:hypothetical protein
MPTGIMSYLHDLALVIEPDEAATSGEGEEDAVSTLYMPAANATYKISLVKQYLQMITC